MLHWPSAAHEFLACKPAGGGIVMASALQIVKKRAVRCVVRILKSFSRFKKKKKNKMVVGGWMSWC